LARRAAALLVLAFLWTPAAHAQHTSSWVGGGDENWGNITNWSAGVPGLSPNTTNAIVNVGLVQVIDPTDPTNITTVTYSCTIDGGTYSINNLTVGDTPNNPTNTLLTVQNGGSLTTNSSIIGNDFDSFGEIDVTGTNTIFTTTSSDLLVGNNGEGILVAATQGLVVASGNIIVGGPGGAQSELALNGGTAAANGTIEINTFSFLFGKGTLAGNVTSDGFIEPSGFTVGTGVLSFNQNLALTANSEIDFSLTGNIRGTQYSAINVVGNLAVNGTFFYSLDNNYTPAVGTVFSLLQVNGNLTGNFTNVTPPSIAGGLGWDISNLTNNGTVTVVPVFTLQPANTTVILSQTANFTVATSGTPPPVFQWQVYDSGNATWTNLTDNTTVIGSNTSNLSISNTTSNQNGQLYRALSANPLAYGISNNATLTINTTINWSGNTSTDWTNAANWLQDVSPNAILSPIIDQPSGNQPNLAGNISAANVTTIGQTSNSSANTSLTISGGSAFTGNATYLAFAPNSTGALDITDANTTVVLAKSIYVGWNGTGNLTVANGATLANTQFGYLGTNPGSSGTATITGANSSWTNDADLNVGYYGVGNLTIANGASVTSATRISVAAQGSSTGIITLNNGTLAVTGGNSSITFNPHGTLAGNGTVLGPVTVAGNLSPTGLLIFNSSLSLTPTAKLNFPLGGNIAGSGYGAIAVNGSIILGGNVFITLTNGYVPTSGTVFSLLEPTANFTSTVSSVTTPFIPGGLGLDVTHISTDGNVDVVVVISSSTGNQTIIETQNTAFTVVPVVVGDTLKFQWQHSLDGGVTWTNLLASSHVSGVKTATLEITNATVDMSGRQYRAEVTNDIATGTSDPAVLTVIPQFTVVTQLPALTSVLSGNTVTFTFNVVPGGNSTLTYQWYKNGKIIKGAIFPALSFGSVSKTNNGTYTVVATNTFTNNTLPSGLAKLTVVTKPPHIVTNPRSVSTKTGRTATFRSYANGDQTLFFQWQISTDNGLDWTNLANGPGPGTSYLTGAVSNSINNSVLVISGVSPLNDGQYRLNVVNAADSPTGVTSKTATLTVN
jgi:T5SS/PEP-CTERM-associated repeat protein